MALPYGSGESAGFEIRRVSAESTEILHVVGDVDLSTAPLLERAIAEAPPDRPVIVDFSACPYLDSSGLTLLVKAYKQRGASLSLVVPATAQIRRVFSIVRLDAVLRIESTVEAIAG
jgi:anti-sigma B factor antagonist